VSSVTLADPTGLGYGESDNCTGRTLDPGATCAITVTLTPTRAATSTVSDGSVVRISDDSVTGPDNVALTATTGRPSALFDTFGEPVSSGTVDFGAVTAGMSSTAKPVGLLNNPVVCDPNGCAYSSYVLILPPGAVTLSGADPADFTINSDGCSGQRIAPDSDCAVTVSFTPQPGATGPVSATLTFNDNASGGPQMVTLQGQVVSPTPLYAWGANGSGQLGDGSGTDSSTPVGVTGLPANDPVAAIAAGDVHSLALTQGGVVYTWGSNQYGQLGNPNDGYNTTTAASVTGTLEGNPVAAIAGGLFHSLALTRSGSVYAWGYNADGELGNASAGSSSATPVQVMGLPANDPVTAIASGHYHSLALTRSGAVYAWGANGVGQLGPGTSAISSTTPVQVTGLPAGVVAVAGGYGYSLALTGDGAVYAWGYNGDGELGNGNMTDSATPVAVTGLPANDPVVALAGGASHVLAVTRSGVVYAWGLNSDGELGNGSSDNNAHPTPAPVSGLPANDPVVAVTAGNAHSLALTRSGAVYAWGANTSGQLGDGNTTDSATPVAVTGLPANAPVVALAGGGAHSLALTDQRAAEASLTPSTLDYHTVFIGGGPVTETTILTSTGVANLQVYSATIIGPDAGDFAISGGDFASGGAGSPGGCQVEALAPGAGCSIDVVFAPGSSSAINRTAWLLVYDNAPYSPQAVPLTGQAYSGG